MNKDFREFGDFIARLRREQEKYGKLTIAVDFDDTMCHYDDDNIVPTVERKENEDICNLMRDIGNRAFFILWTCRSGEQLDDALVWIKNHNIPIHAVGENPMVDCGGKKIHANVFLDDRAGLQQAYKALSVLYRRE